MNQNSKHIIRAIYSLPVNCPSKIGTTRHLLPIKSIAYTKHNAMREGKNEPGSTAATREIAEADDKLFELPYASESHPTEPFCENAEDTPKPTTRSASLLSLSLVLSPTLSLSMRLCSLSTFLSL
eukprot:c18928_g1_i1 orf=29-403(-)